MPDTPETPERALEQVRDDPASRKRFLRMVGGTGAAGALGLLLAACGGSDRNGARGGSSQGGGGTKNRGGGSARGDVAIVSYALMLEHLETDFYDQVVQSGLIGDRKIASLAKTFGDHERRHVEALKATMRKLGATPAPPPKTDFRAVLDGGPKKILRTAATVENLGAAAYLGQVANISSQEVLAAALSIHTVEARHAAALNEAAGRGFEGGDPLSGSIPDGAFARPLPMEAVLQRVKPFLAS